MSRDPLTTHVSVERPARTPWLKSGLAFMATACATAPLGYMLMLSGFHEYDDEGYMLVTVRDYLGGHAIVTPYVQLYGPFFYEVVGGVYRLIGLEPGHDNGRILTLGMWLIACLLGGVAGYRMTRNLWLGIGTQLVTFSVLIALVMEPFTTYALIGVLVTGVVLSATFISTRPRIAAVAIGGIVGALCLVKINVGGFVAIAVFAAWAVGLPPRSRRVLAPAAVLLLMVLPPVLMAGMLGSAWVVEIALVVSMSAAAVGAVWLGAGPRDVRMPSAWWFVAGAAVVTAVCVGVALLGGTGAVDLWNGLIASSLRFPGIFVLPPAVEPANVFWAGLALTVAIAVSIRFPEAASRPSFGIVRVWVGVVIWLVVLRQPTSTFLVGLPLVWMAAQRAPADAADAVDPAGDLCRLLLPLLAVMGSLQIYPVAGTQQALASLGLVPVGAIILRDGVRQLRSPTVPRPVTRLARLVVSALVLVMVASLGYLTVVTANTFQSKTALDLPGSHALRLPAADVSDLRSLVASIDRDCSSFITYPGMDSLYVWTNQPPPTAMRYGLWWLSLDSAQQEALVQQLQNRPRLCVVKNQTVNDFWAQGRSIPQRPLVRFIEQAFVPAGTYGDYQLLVRSP